jgi:hypothetical protein
MTNKKSKVLKKKVKKAKKKPKPKVYVCSNAGTRWMFVGFDYRDVYITKHKYITAEEAIWEDGAQLVFSIDERYVASPYPKPKE